MNTPNNPIQLLQNSLSRRHSSHSFATRTLTPTSHSPGSWVMIFNELNVLNIYMCSALSSRERKQVSEDALKFPSISLSMADSTLRLDLFNQQNHTQWPGERETRTDRDREKEEIWANELDLISRKIRWILRNSSSILLQFPIQWTSVLLALLRSEQKEVQLELNGNRKRPIVNCLIRSCR